MLLVLAELSVVHRASCLSQRYLLFTKLHVIYRATRCSHCCLLFTLLHIVQNVTRCSHCYPLFTLFPIVHTVSRCSQCSLFLALLSIVHTTTRCSHCYPLFTELHVVHIVTFCSHVVCSHCDILVFYMCSQVSGRRWMERSATWPFFVMASCPLTVVHEIASDWISVTGCWQILSLCLLIPVQLAFVSSRMMQAEHF